MPRRLVPFLLVALAALPALAQQTDGVHTETGVDRVRSEFGLTGAGALVAVLDRGLDVEHPDFRNADGSTRVVALLDLTDNSGANAPDNPWGVGTVYTRAEIDAALAAGTRLATRDAVGHGTASAGIAAGNGRASDGLYTGVAPDADLVIVKFTTEGAAAHDGEPAEAPFYNPALLPAALNFVDAMATAEGKPVVILANFGSVGGPMDGTSTIARVIDDRFGDGIPGRVFLTGSSDDGGVDNHAGGTVTQGETAEIRIRKGHAGALRLNLWYPASDRFTVEVVSPNGSVTGPYAPPANGARASGSGSGFVYYHNGNGVDFFGAASATREILIDFSGAAGTFTVRLTGTSVADGRFDASLNPSTLYSRPDNVFETFVEAGYTVWDAAAARDNLPVNSYVLQPTWTDVDGATQTYPGNDVGMGELWPGSGVGPTYDGRLGIAVSAPGQGNITPYAPRSIFATARYSVIRDGDAPYGVLGFVSGAAPVVTGIVALLLDADPTLDAAQVRAALEQTARTDAFTGVVPNTQWGYGKVDAYAATALVRGGTADEPDARSGGLSLTTAPNPAHGGTTVTLTLDAPSSASVTLSDLLGRRVGVLHEGPLGAGAHRIAADLSGLPAGVYLVRVEAGGAVVARTVAVVR